MKTHAPARSTASGLHAPTRAISGAGSPNTPLPITPLTTAAVSAQRPMARINPGAATLMRIGAAIMDRWAPEPPLPKGLPRRAVGPPIGQRRSQRRLARNVQLQGALRRFSGNHHDLRLLDCARRGDRARVCGSGIRWSSSAFTRATLSAGGGVGTSRLRRGTSSRRARGDLQRSTPGGRRSQRWLAIWIRRLDPGRGSDFGEDHISALGFERQVYGGSVNWRLDARLPRGCGTVRAAAVRSSSNGARHRVSLAGLHADRVLRCGSRFGRDQRRPVSSAFQQSGRLCHRSSRTMDGHRGLPSVALSPSILPAAGPLMRDRPEASAIFGGDPVFSLVEQPTFVTSAISLTADTRDFPGHPLRGGVIHVAASSLLGSRRRSGEFPALRGRRGTVHPVRSRSRRVRRARAVRRFRHRRARVSFRSICNRAWVATTHCGPSTTIASTIGTCSVSPSRPGSR